MNAPHSADHANDLSTLRNSLRKFVADRDWDQFHNPKSLAIALSVEASELLEHFQWLTESDPNQLSAEKRDQILEEIADVLLYSNVAKA